MSFFQLGGGYLFGLPMGFVANSIGAIVGAKATFLLGRTISFSSFIIFKYLSKLYKFLSGFATQ